MKTKVMGILNCTPDSFSDGGLFLSCDAALKQAASMIEEGADIIDVGGESTRPGATPLSLQEELDRVLPVIEAISNEFPVTISIDTYKSHVMEEALKHGANFINDTHALQEKGAIDVAAKYNVTICLMHMQNKPQNMQENPVYEDVIQEITTFFKDRIEACENAGIARERLILDPGFGFGKNDYHNVCILKNLKSFKSLNLPILLGVSRKATIGRLLKREVQDRLYGSIALAAYAVAQGVSIIRAHDIRATVDAVNIITEVVRT